MYKTPSILIIDDEPLMRISMSDALEAEGYYIESAESGGNGLEALKSNLYDIVITDLKLPEVDGLQILKNCKNLLPRAKVLMITAYGSVETAVEAMKQGAYDYIKKPFSMDELILMIKRLVALRDLEDENIYLREKVEDRYDFSGIIGKSEKIKDIFEKIRIVAQSDATVLVTGESGTGKELVANALHHNSPRKGEAFVKISCAALPETLLEAELFGYEKGAYTGAFKQKKGRFELADKGSLFLDEIGEISPLVQVKLLRVLEERQFERLGGVETINVDVRVICATQRDLKKEVQKGNFREDLYYRLNVVPVYLPPLRDRREDILVLADHFMHIYSKQMNKQIKELSPEVRELLLKYSFPGNVRELENAMERAVTLCKGEEIQIWDLPEEISSLKAFVEKELDKMRDLKPEPSLFLSNVLSTIERQYIVRVLEWTKGDLTNAAAILGMSRKTLWEKRKAYGLLKEKR